ncbi:uncharacterized protein JCM15063_006430 [Sporobolomyces koalae]|uniref:uncharacterized protein n=1 Tax=Sporobolomyces koalae TaxID=500713 RepID=UPI00316E02CF
MRVCVVTGCSSGLGRLVLSRLVQSPQHWRVLAGYRSMSPPPPLESSNQASTVEWIPLDLASENSVDGFIKQVTQRVRGLSTGSLDCLLLNAATWNSTHVETDTKFSQEVHVNHFAQYRIATQLLPLLTKPSTTSTPRPRVIFTSSSLQNTLRDLQSLDDLEQVLGNCDHPLSTPKNRYACSKLVQSIAFHLWAQDNLVDVIGVSPGFVPTTGLSRSSPGWQRWIMRNIVYWFPFCSTEQQGDQGRGGLYTELQTLMEDENDERWDKFKQIWIPQ